MKPILLFFILIISKALIANDYVDPSSPLDETGLKISISDEELRSLDIWAKDTKRELDLLIQLNEFENDLAKKIENFRSRFHDIVTTSTDINYLNMRKNLNRGMHIDNLLSNKRNSNEFRLKLYEHILSTAKDNYVSDIEFIESSSIDERKFILGEYYVFLKILDLGRERKTRISEEDLTALLKRYLQFIVNDLLESSYRNAVAFEIRNITRFLEDNFSIDRLKLITDLFDDAFETIYEDHSSSKERFTHRVRIQNEIVAYDGWLGRWVVLPTF